MLSPEILAQLPADQRLRLANFQSADIQPADFSHRDHVHVTWLYLSLWRGGHANYETIRSEINASLLRIVTTFGAEAKYSRTLSDAYLLLTADAYVQHAGDSFDAFAEHWPALLDFKATIGVHYSDDLLQKPAARQTFLAPDRRALPVIAPH